MHKESAPLPATEVGAGYSPEAQGVLVDEQTQVMPPTANEARSWSAAMKSPIPATGQNIA